MPSVEIHRPEFPLVDFAAIQNQLREQEYVKLGYAHVMHEQLLAQIHKFEASLKPNEEIAGYLASFGTCVLVLLSRVGFQDPFFITFSGINAATKEKVHLVQHVSLISVLFTAVTVPKEENRKARRIGFIVDTDKEDETPQTEGQPPPT